MRNFNTKKLTVCGLMAALVMVSTMIIQIPAPVQGYIHLGDSIVYLSGIILGPLAGGLAAAIGSALADLFSGYAIYALPSFIIKGLVAITIGYCYNVLTATKAATSLTRIFFVFVLGVVLGGIMMIGGYYVIDALLLNSFIAALANIPANITQAVGGGILALPLLLTLKKAGIADKQK